MYATVMFLDPEENEITRSTSWAGYSRPIPPGATAVHIWASAEMATAASCYRLCSEPSCWCYQFPGPGRGVSGEHLGETP